MDHGSLLSDHFGRLKEDVEGVGEDRPLLEDCRGEIEKLRNARGPRRDDSVGEYKDPLATREEWLKLMDRQTGAFVIMGRPENDTQGAELELRRLRNECRPTKARCVGKH